MNNEKLIQKMNRYRALNKHHSEFIQKNGHCSTAMKKELKALEEIVSNNEVVDLKDYEVRLTINYMIRNENEEIYNLSVALKKNEKYVSIWTYFYSMLENGIVSREKTIDDNDDTNKYDIFKSPDINEDIQDTLIMNGPGKTIYWNDSEKYFE